MDAMRKSYADVGIDALLPAYQKMFRQPREAAVVDNRSTDMLISANSQLRAENEALRAALRSVINKYCGGTAVIPPRGSEPKRLETSRDEDGNEVIRAL